MGLKLETGSRVILGGFGPRGPSQSRTHVVEESAGLRLEPPEQDEALGDFGTCRCGKAFYLADHLQRWLSKAIKAAQSTATASLDGPKVPDLNGMVFHSRPLEFNITCTKCGTTLAGVLQGSSVTNQRAVAVTISLSMPQKTIHYSS